MAKIPPQFLKKSKGKKKAPPKKGGDTGGSDFTGQMMSMDACMKNHTHDECVQMIKKGGKMPPMKNMRNM